MLIAVLLLAGALATSEQRCQPNSVFKLDCNTCRCDSAGRVASCTRRFCLPEEMGDDPNVLADTSGRSNGDEETVVTNAQACTPNEVKFEDCNRCKCAANGIGWFCTRKTCPREKRDTPTSSYQCKPGSSFKSQDGCNDCFCTDNGIAACTMKFCFPAKDARSRRDTESQCEPGTNFKSKDGCNDCFCTKTGHAACTLRHCEQMQGDQPAAEEAPLPKSEIAPGAPGFSCDPGRSFKYQCNTCRCDVSGKMAACTLRYCLPGEY